MRLALYLYTLGALIVGAETADWRKRKCLPSDVSSVAIVAALWPLAYPVAVVVGLFGYEPAEIPGCAILAGDNP